MPWQDNVRRVKPYVPGEQPNKKNMIKLNTNECPYPPADEVQEVFSSFNAAGLRLYPDPEGSDLVEELARYYGVDKSRVFVGVGSDDVLAIAFMTFFNSDKPILFPNITYSFYPVWAELFGIKYVTKAVDEQFSINAADYYGGNGGVIFPNPNAPTSVYESLEKVEDIISHNRDAVVIVDEAYIDFGGESALSLIDKYDNLLVVRTFSKSRSMAGMRIGFAIGSTELIKAMNDVKFSFNSYTMSRISLAAGVAALKADDYFKKITEKIINTRERAKERLCSLGFSFPDSETNFLFVSHKKYNAKDIFEYLKTKDIYVRYFDKPGIDNYLRITIGTDEQMERLYSTLEEFIGE